MCNWKILCEVSAGMLTSSFRIFCWLICSERYFTHFPDMFSKCPLPKVFWSTEGDHSKHSTRIKNFDANTVLLSKISCQNMICVSGGSCQTFYKNWFQTFYACIEKAHAKHFTCWERSIRTFCACRERSCPTFYTRWKFSIIPNISHLQNKIVSDAMHVVRNSFSSRNVLLVLENIIFRTFYWHVQKPLTCFLYIGWQAASHERKTLHACHSINLPASGLLTVQVFTFWLLSMHLDRFTSASGILLEWTQTASR